MDCEHKLKILEQEIESLKRGEQAAERKIIFF